MAANRDLKELKASIDFMRDRLGKTREALADADVVIPYDNGGGQTGLRANPAYSEYEKLLKAYQKALTLYDELAEGKQGENGDAITAFLQRRARTDNKNRSDLPEQ